MPALQWLSAAAFLYAELFAGILLCLPFISNARWQKIFTSRLVAAIKRYGNYYFLTFVLIMIFLFLDSVFQVRKYSKVEGANHVDLHNNPHAEVSAHMKLFRAQRNCYISGFALFLLPCLRRLVTLISSHATLEASQQAVIKQAEGATLQCKKLLDENEELRKGGSKSTKAVEIVDSQEQVKLEKELKDKKEELEEKEKILERTKKDLEAMKAQSEGLHKEYDRLLDENERLEKKLKIQGVDEESKKDS